MYTIFKIPKRKGGFRQIENPDSELKEKQRQILKKLRKEHRTSPFCYAFEPYRNISCMAMSHVGKKWVANFDVADFFPSISLEKFSVKVSDISVNVKDYCFHDFNDGKGKRLPQGAPTSPFLSNLYLKKFDWQMAWLCYARKCDYSRYADDIVISGEDRLNVSTMIASGANILSKYFGLTIHPTKTKIVPNSRRQLVCGVVVNTKLNTQRKLRKNLRAELHQLKLKGGEIPNETRGRVAFHQMIRETKKTTLSSTDIITQIMVVKALTGEV